MTQCKGKIRYDSMLEANTALLKLWKQFQRGDSRRTERRAYICVVCGGCHLTSKATLEDLMRKETDDEACDCEAGSAKCCRQSEATQR